MHALCKMPACKLPLLANIILSVVSDLSAACNHQLLCIPLG